MYQLPLPSYSTHYQQNLLGKRHGGLVRRFCPKYGSFVVVTSPWGSSFLGAWHLSESSTDSRREMSRQRLSGVGVSRQTSGERHIRPLIRHVTSPLTSECIVYSHFLQTWHSFDTIRHTRLRISISEGNLILYWLLFVSFFPTEIGSPLNTLETFQIKISKAGCSALCPG